MYKRTILVRANLRLHKSWCVKCYKTSAPPCGKGAAGDAPNGDDTPNFLIDRNNTLKIIDFGSARIAGLAEIKTPVEHAHILGTANYSAPEYFKGESGTNRSDIFSLGVIAYEMLTGKLPYGEVTPQFAEKKRFNYTPASEHNSSVPEWIDNAIRKAVDPNPAKRYTLLSEFVSDLAKPNQRLIKKEAQPLMQRNPLKFWQVVAVLEFLLILLLFVKP
ncbi:hypothetical protein BOW37_10250 [Solemya velum gill symbiont]|nr:hypothetical protein BOW37_10250 [Solemya velum gill symbiont]OOZ48404.1 hypothetical protein BOW39_10840 [Solemya velum gill symbiont]OOZ50440.1 hypothetical protein BOW40_10255 [Solemya velum gill symbiont]OOZ53339.1 hypothetical protein BOW41_10485 [Solemya velum gill symbiont]